MNDTKKYNKMDYVSNPVIQCKVINRNDINHTGSNPSMGLNVAIAHPEKITIDEMAPEIQHSTAANEADVHLVWQGMRQQILKALLQGKRVVLGDIGTISVDVRTKEPKMVGDNISGHDIEIGHVSFKPSNQLRAQFNNVHFKVIGQANLPLDEQGIAEGLEVFFRTHTAISIREFGALTHYGLTTARALMKDYVDKGLMEWVPDSNHRYRPTKGHFGW